MNPTRARDLAARYQMLRTAYDLNPTDATSKELGRTWNALARELQHQTGRVFSRDERWFGDPAAAFDRSA